MPLSGESGNLFNPLPDASGGEVFETLLRQKGLHLERITSLGQAGAEGDWYDQQTDEWVVLLKGGARLRFEDEAQDRVLEPGDYLFIKAHRRHRVTWTAPDIKTVWLALHVINS